MNQQNSLKSQPSNDTCSQLVRYTLVGGIAFLLDIGTYTFALKLLNFHYTFAAALGFAVGALTNYLLSITWVFSKRRLSTPAMEFVIFLAIGLIGLGMMEVMLWGLIGKMGTDPILARLFTVVIVYLWNFFARKYSLFT